jgi:hypothetical protein
MAEIKPVRLQRSRAKGAQLVSPNGLPVVCVTRPGVFGNPFSAELAKEIWPQLSDVEAKQKAVNSFRDFIVSGAAYGRAVQSLRQKIIARLPELRGKNLACWCKPGEPCHADVLLELANRV